LATKSNHHFIPQFYLRGFAQGVGRQAKVFTFDKDTKGAFSTLVRNVGSRRHFFRVDADGVDKNFIEDEMSKIEAVMSAHLKDVIEARRFPSEDHYASVMNIAANLAIRIPRVRDISEGMYIDVARRIMNLSVSSPEIWRSQIEQMRKAGKSIRADLEYEEARKFVEDGSFEITVNQTHLIQLEFKMLLPVVDYCSRRNWCFISAPNGSQFISSDNPVVLSWTDGDERTPYSPGHGLPGTMVVFPLSSDLLLLGTFEDLAAETSYCADQVVAANTLIAHYAMKQIYARDGSFSLALRDGKHIRGDELPSHFKPF
jgi:hypothetical protein